MLHGSQRAVGLLVLVILGSMSASASSSGASVRSSTHFTVLAPDARLADTVVAQAEQFRSRVGEAWLGCLPLATPTPTVVFIEIDAERSFARTLIDPAGGRHMVWLIGSKQAVTEHLLAHEVAHVVLAEKFGNGMPVWANEGIASQYDNAKRMRIRSRLLTEFAEIDSWPHLDRLFERPIKQQWQYAAAVSVTDFLVELRGRTTFIEFVADGQKRGWNQSLDAHYGMASIEHLQTEWQRAVRLKNSLPRAATVAATTDSARLIR